MVWASLKVFSIFWLSVLAQSDQSDLSDSEFLETLGLPETNKDVAETPPEDTEQPDCGDGDGSNLSNEDFVKALLNGCKNKPSTKEVRTVARCHRNRYTCAPYHKCNQEHIVSNGAGLFNLRILLREYEEAGDRVTHSDCRRLGEVCCIQPISDGGGIDVTEEQDSQPKCGKRNRDGVGAKIRNVSDKITQFGEVSWMCALIKAEKTTNTNDNVGDNGENDQPKHIFIFVSGCSLVGKRHVLTSAHNLVLENIESGPVDVSTLMVRLGEWDAQSETEVLPHKDIPVVHVYKHPQFDQRSLIHDLAVLELSSPVEIMPHIGPICLPAGEDFTNSDCFATGWGKDRFVGGTFQTVLRRVPLKLVAHEQCQRQMQGTERLGKYFRLDESFMCAIGAEQGDDTCTGDGGSPLVCEREDGSYAQVGIVSWGIGCGRLRLPGVYADVRQYTDWIQSHVNAQ